MNNELMVTFGYRLVPVLGDNDGKDAAGKEVWKRTFTLRTAAIS